MICGLSKHAIKSINDNMQKYLKGSVFEEFEGFILVERTAPDGPTAKRIGFALPYFSMSSCLEISPSIERTAPDGQKRLGLVIAVDLEDYEYTPENNALYCRLAIIS